MNLSLIKLFLIFLYIATLNAISNINISKEVKQGYIKVSNGNLYYQTFGSGDPIIILHGGPGLNHQYLLPQILPLSQGHQITLYDQRGSGQSFNTITNSKTINVKQFVEDLEDGPVLRKLHFGATRMFLLF